MESCAAAKDVESFAMVSKSIYAFARQFIQEDGYCFIQHNVSDGPAISDNLVKLVAPIGFGHAEYFSSKTNKDLDNYPAVNTKCEGVTHHLYSSFILESSTSSRLFSTMAQFTPVNIDPTANGAYFSMQLANGEDELDVFAVFGLRADRTALDARALRSHFRKVLIPHCFERGTASSAKTQGPEIPTWQIANVAKGILWAQDASSLVRLQETWIGNPKPSVQVWNPFAEPGSPEYFLPVASKAKHEYDTARDQGANIPGSQAKHNKFSEKDNPKRFKVNFYWSYLEKGGTLRQMKL
ncbi:MAG: hypothetical protein ALECFALPRED_001691 [Alectoria fallacina]|uniref:Uncharacterized protein n=1 Tax=Alectoria fallacina TaxID=1903189 RepID=A0A8H3FFM2_9LECA|nr:MAG: hypothetical protein ALECFALPRED_001691 [Alectoria fallacina]